MLMTSLLWWWGNERKRRRRFERAPRALEREEIGKVVVGEFRSEELVERGRDLRWRWRRHKCGRGWCSLSLSLEMKVKLYGLKGKQISLTLLALVSGIILVWAWAWDKTHLLTSFLPPSISVSIGTHPGPSPGPAPNFPPFPAFQPVFAPSHVHLTPTASTTEIPIGSLEEQTRHSQETNGEMSLEQAEMHSDIGTPISSVSTTSYNNGSDSNLTLSLVDKKACNYAKGKWVKDSNRPLYSGFGCKQWLSEMWACRLTQRTDFSYENFRWRPSNCDMPEFRSSSVLKRMQDKTIAIIGDSLGRQQFQSLMCMLTGGKKRPDVLDVGREYGLVKAHGAIRPDGWAYRFRSTNTTILYYWSASLCDLEPIDRKNPATDWAMHLDRPPAFLRRYLYRFNVLILNTGHHWNRGKLRANKWVMYIGGVPNTNRKLAEIGRAKNFTIYSVVKWLDLQLPKHPKLKAFLRTISPRHFFNGDWNSGGSCDNTNPLAGGMEVLQDESSDPIASGAVKGTQVKLLDITSLSQLRDEGHISRYSIKATPGVQDCLHWCLPGVPDTWNEILLSQV